MELLIYWLLRCYAHFPGTLRFGPNFDRGLSILLSEHVGKVVIIVGDVKGGG